jgi:hypothetical protein
MWGWIYRGRHADAHGQLQHDDQHLEHHRLGDGGQYVYAGKHVSDCPCDNADA